MRHLKPIHKYPLSLHPKTLISPKVNGQSQPQLIFTLWSPIGHDVTKLGQNSRENAYRHIVTPNPLRRENRFRQLKALSS